MRLTRKIWGHSAFNISKAECPRLLVILALLTACSAQSGVRTYDCETGGRFTVTYEDSGVLFDYRDKPYSLPSTERPGVYAEGEMTLKQKGEELSLRIADEVVVWGCTEIR